MEMKTPCVVFTGHPSLRFGDVVHFIELWGKSSSNAIVFTGNNQTVFSVQTRSFIIFAESNVGFIRRFNESCLGISEPDFPYLEALAPYQPLAMMVSN